MAFYSKDGSYSVGIPDIDLQHQALLELHGRLRRAVLHDVAPELSIILLDQLREDFREHFLFEERLMAADGHGLAAEHVRAHRGLIHDLDSFLRLADGNPERALLQALDFVERWLTAHVLDLDMRTFRPAG